MRPEDFTVSSHLDASQTLDCPEPGCNAELKVHTWAPDAITPDLGSLLDAARDHLTNRHPGEGPNHD